MSIWPFGRTKPKPRAPQPLPSQSGAGEKIPAGGAASEEIKREGRSGGVRSKDTLPTAAATAAAGRGARATPAAPVLDKSANVSADTRKRTSLKAKERAREKPGHVNVQHGSSPMDIDDIDTQRRPSTGGSMRAEKVTALPGSKPLQTSPHLRPVTQSTTTAEAPYNFRSQTSLPSNTSPTQSRRGNKLQRNPSRNKRTAQYESPLARRRSSKKRKNDPVREEEIRAMSRPIDVPRRAGGGHGDTGLLRRESRKTRGPLNRNLERPVSTVSLPFEESIHSSMSGDAEPRNYRLSVLDVMSPRPAIRHRDMQKTYTNDTASSNLLRKSSRSDKHSAGKHTQTWRPTKEEKAARDRARIDSLADDMDSTDLREIMERDRKRKEKRREKDHERLQRKLERRAEKQRTKDWLEKQQSENHLPITEAETEARPAEAAALGSTQGKDIDTHMAEDTDFHMEDVQAEDPFVDAHEMAAPDLPAVDPIRMESTTSIPAEDIHPALRTPKQQKQAEARLGEPEVVEPQLSPTSPTNEDSRFDLTTPMSEVRTPMDTPAIGTAHAVSYTAARPVTPLSPVTSAVYHGDRAKASKLLGADVAGGSYTVSNTILDEATSPRDPPPKMVIPERAETVVKRDVPETALSPSKKKSGFFSSIFRGSRRSISGAPRAAVPMSESSFSNTSREEMSRNIPSHLVSQPSSATSFRKAGPPLRTQSIFREDLPESPLSPPDSRVTSPIDAPAVPRSRYNRNQNRIPSAIMSEEGGDTDTERPGSPLSVRDASQIMAHSLASVDSEASWLSGGRHRAGSAPKKPFTRLDDFSGSFEELGMPEDEYFRRLNPASRTEQPSGLSAAIAGSQKASSAALREDSEVTPTKADMVVEHRGASRQPTVVHREGGRHKSSEGLLNTFNSQAGATLLSATETEASDAEAGAEDHTPEAEYPTPAESPRSSEEVEATPVQRATSVNLGRGHARNVSAGSAKLLDIPRRGSRDVGSAMNTPNPPATPVRSQTMLAEEAKE